MVTGFAALQFADQFGIKNIDCRQDGTPLGEKGGRAGYLFNTGIAGIEEADSILLIGTNPRIEGPVLNARIRKAWRASNMPIGVIGEGGERLKRIGTEARQELEKLMDAKVFIELWVKVRSGWADDEARVRSFGYE